MYICHICITILLDKSFERVERQKYLGLTKNLWEDLKLRGRESKVKINFSLVKMFGRRISQTS